MDTLWTIALVMLASGILGGLINFYVSQHNDDAPLPPWQHVVVGVGASFMVPLFLNMISSGLIDQVRGTATEAGDPSKLFVLAGFCLVAAVSSRAFIQTISRRIIRELEETKVVAREARADAAVATAAVAPLVEDDASDSVAQSGMTESVAMPDLSPTEEAIIRTLASSSYSMRSLTGTAKDTRLDKPQVNTAFTSLMRKGLVGQAQNAEGKLRFYLTPAGRAYGAPLLTKPAA